MLNKNNVRELAYVVRVDLITSIPGYDRVELAHVGGWTIVVGKDEFTAGDCAIYFEIDSQLPEVAPFTNMEFLAKKHYKIKTQKMCKSISQGLLMSANNFGWQQIIDNEGSCGILDSDGVEHYVHNESRFLTSKLGVTYAVSEDNSRKASSADKYKLMARRHYKLFSHQPFKWMMRHQLGKKLLFLIFGKPSDVKSAWPSWVSKTDEERIQNIPWILDSKERWIATEKIDGTSTTFTMKRNKGLFGVEYQYTVCSRNVAFNKDNKNNCFYETNVYLEMSDKYSVEKVLRSLLDDTFPEASWITIQGETYGASIQNRTYSINNHDFCAFNLIIDGFGRIGSVEGAALLATYDIPWVPFVDNDFVLPNTVDELLDLATGKSAIDGLPREGLVLRTTDGKKSFKAVSNEYLLKYHE